MSSLKRRKSDFGERLSDPLILWNFMEFRGIQCAYITSPAWYQLIYKLFRVTYTYVRTYCSNRIKALEVYDNHTSTLETPTTKKETDLRNQIIWQMKRQNFTRTTSSPLRFSLGFRKTRSRTELLLSFQAWTETSYVEDGNWRETECMVAFHETQKEKEGQRLIRGLRGKHP